MAVLIWFLQNGQGSMAEAAALYQWVHGHAGRGFIDAAAGAEPLRVIMRDQLFSLPGSIIAGVVEALAQGVGDKDLTSSAFTSLLELAEAAGTPNEDLAQKLAGSYPSYLIREHHHLRTGRIGQAGAKVLMNLPLGPVARARLLYPIDVRERLNALAEDDNPYTADRSIADGLRAHIRVLARAVASLGLTVPADLVAALISAVNQGLAFDHPAGRVSAFHPQFEVSPFGAGQDRPIAEDLVAALAALRESDRDRLLGVLLQVQEPMILANLYPFVQSGLRSQIEARLDALTPEAAAPLYSLTELQGRVDSLLSAGLTRPAAAYMAAERAASTLGQVAGRSIRQLTAELRLKLAEADWEGILTASLPSDLNQMEEADGRDALSFYRGLAHLIRQDRPAPDRAEQIFTELHARKPHVGAYIQNRFAARVARRLGDDLFRLLDPVSAREARQDLEENRRLTVDRVRLPPSEQSIIVGNEALLLLAIDAPAEAFAALASLPQAHFDPRAVAYQAVALARLGRRSEALESLKTAESLGGSETLFQAARMHIDTGGAVALPVSTTDQEGRLAAVHAALLDLLHMDAHDQARALSGRHADLEHHLTSELQEAASSLIRLVPMMKAVVVSDSEDDLNALLGEMLTHRMHLLKWAVLDQTKGGHSGRGNAGERDLVVKREATELCAVEAVICETPLNWEKTRTNLTSHLEKLFGYTAAKILYHVTYAYGVNLDELKKLLITIAKAMTLAGFKVTSITELRSGDARPDGFRAAYSAEDAAVTVVFLVLDLGQVRARVAAAEARGAVSGSTLAPPLKTPKSRSATRPKS